MDRRRMDINRARNDSIGENKRAVKNVKRISQRKAKKRKQILAGVIAGMIIGASLGVLGTAVADKYADNNILLNAKKMYYDYTYVYHVDDGFAYDYVNTVSAIAKNDDFDIDTQLYLLSLNYYYSPKDQMNRLISIMKSFKEVDKYREFDEYENFDEYVKDLGYESFDDYTKRFGNVAIDSIKNEALINYSNPNYPVKYDIENNKYEFQDNERSKDGWKVLS